MKYPYFIVQTREGRLPVPFEYRGTTVARLFVSGKIGGVRSEEYQTSDPEEVRRRALIAERSGKIVDVYVVERSNTCRRMCRNWRNPGWKGK